MPKESVTGEADGPLFLGVENAANGTGIWCCVAGVMVPVADSVSIFDLTQAFILLQSLNI